MRVGFTAEHWNDKVGNPAGGTTFGAGFAIGWQNGPLGRGDDRKEPNGAFVEDVIAACADRLEYYQTGVYPAISNARALMFLRRALEVLEGRTEDREERGVEGTYAK